MINTPAVSKERSAMDRSGEGGEAYKWRSSYGAYSAVNSYAYHDPDALSSLPVVKKTLSGNSATGSTGTSVTVTDWNARHQAVQDLPEVTHETRMAKRRAITTLYSEFLAVVEGAGRKIIEEINFPVTMKTLQPANAGGVAGGEKFIVDSIFFKLASDSHRLYGGDHFAAKAAGHELKGLNALLKCNATGLRLPLVAILDYRGHRLFASSILPIDHGTLVYGSDDAGARVLADPQIHELMKGIGMKLHLKEHLVGAGEAAKSLVGPADIEVHRARDDRLYIVDTARLFPPCMGVSTVQGVFVPAEMRLVSTTLQSSSSGPTPVAGPVTSQGDANAALSHYVYPAEEHTLSKKNWKTEAFTLLHISDSVDALVEQADDYTVISKRSASVINERASAVVGRAVRGDVLLFRRLVGRHLYELMRSEFLSAFPQPLSSDAFSSFKLPNGPAEMQEVIAATEHLSKVTIPEVARLLDSKQLLPVNASDLKIILHERGINLRFLGVLRFHCRDTFVRHFLLTVMLSRIINQQLLKKLRKVKGTSKNEYIDVAIAYFNVVLGSSPQSDAYWLTELKIHLTETFSQASISSSERLPHYDFRLVLQKRPLFQMMQSTSALLLAPELLRALHTRPVFFERPFPFMAADVVELSAHIKPLNYEDLYDEKEVGASGDLLDLEHRGKYLEALQGKSSVPLACNVLQRLRHLLREKKPKEASVLHAQVKSMLLTIQYVPIELLAIFTYSSAHLRELQGGDTFAPFALYRNAHSFLTSAYGGVFGHPFALVVANKCAVLASHCKAFNLATQYCSYVENVWPWIPFPTKDTALKKVVCDSEELIALYDGLPLSPSITDAAAALQEWLRQADLIETALRAPALFVPSSLLSADLTLDLHSSSDIHITEALEPAAHLHKTSLLPPPGSGRLYACGNGKNDSMNYCSFGTRLSLYQPLVSTPIRSVACGSTFVVAAAETGRVYTWGDGRYFKLGHGDTDNQPRPKIVEKLALEDIYQVAIGDAHCVAVSAKGEAFLWGLGTGGQLGCGRIADSHKEPQRPSQLTSHFIVAAACGEAHTVLLTAEGEVWSAGTGASGALGQGSFYEVLHQFCRVEALRGVVVMQVQACAKATFVVTKQGSLLSFGTGSHGELGRAMPDTLKVKLHGRTAALNSSKEIATTFIDSVPRQVMLVGSVSRVWCGDEHAFALLADATLWGWGANSKRQVSPSQCDRIFLPERCLPRDPIAAIAAGTNHTLCAVRIRENTSLTSPSSFASHHTLASSATALPPVPTMPTVGGNAALLAPAAPTPPSSHHRQLAASISISGSISSSGPELSTASPAPITPVLNNSANAPLTSLPLANEVDSVNVLGWGGAAWGAIGLGDQAIASHYPSLVLSLRGPATVICASASTGMTMLVAQGEPDSR